MDISLSNLENPDGKLVKECVDDILSALESAARASDDVEYTSHHDFQITYQIAAKQRELQPTEGDSPSPEIVCEYCGDNSTHVMQVRGGGGLDEMCVTWDRDIQTGDIGVFFSCRSCCADEEDCWETIHGRQRQDTCMGCGIHTILNKDAGLSPVCLCLQDSEGISATDYYFCISCLLGSLGAECDLEGDITSLERLAIDRIQRFRSFIGEENTEIKIPEGVHRAEAIQWVTTRYDLPDPPSTEIGTEDVRRVLFSDPEDDLDSDDDLEMTSDEELFDTYEGEYVNEELPENNTEKAGEIKEAIREIGEKMFDLQEQLKEGDYLEIMNLLQKVTNKVNSL